MKPMILSNVYRPRPPAPPPAEPKNGETAPKRVKLHSAVRRAPRKTDG